DLVERQVQQVVAVLGVDHDLAGSREDLLHGLEIHAFAHDVGSLLVFGQDAGEARGVTAGVAQDLGLVAFGLFGHAGSLAARHGDDLVGIGLPFVDLAFAILACLDGVVERGLHLFGRLHVLDGHGADLDAGLIAVENLLHQVLDLDGDLGTAFVQDEVHGLLANDFAHGRFGGLAHRFVGIAHIEQVVRGAFGAQAILHDELHVDDVFVGGQHERFGQHLVARAATETHFEGTQLRNVDRLGVLDGVRQAPLEAWGLGALVLAELRDDGNLAFLDDVEAAGQPQQHQHQRHHAHPDAGAAWRRRSHSAAIAGPAVAAPALASEKGPDAVVEVAPDLVEIGRAVVVAPGASGRLGTIIVAATPARVIQIE